MVLVFRVIGNGKNEIYNKGKTDIVIILNDTYNIMLPSILHYSIWPLDITEYITMANFNWRKSFDHSFQRAQSLIYFILSNKLLCCIINLQQITSHGIHQEFLLWNNFLFEYWTLINRNISSIFESFTYQFSSNYWLFLTFWLIFNVLICGFSFSHPSLG